MTSDRSHSSSGVLSRAQGCLLGQLIGDSLGSLVEFQSPGEDTLQIIPKVCWTWQTAAPWDTLAGQPTDDSEMALLLARSLVSQWDVR